VGVVKKGQAQGREPDAKDATAPSESEHSANKTQRIPAIRVAPFQAPVRKRVMKSA